MDHSEPVASGIRMEWAQKWWTWNATVVAFVLQVALGLTSVTFTSKQRLPIRHDTCISCCGQCGRKAQSKTANENFAQGLFVMVLVVLLSSVGFISYWNWTGDMSITLVKGSASDSSQDHAESKRIIGIEAVVSFLLLLLLTLGSYLHRWKNKSVVNDLNRKFRTLYQSHPGPLDALRWLKPWDRYGRLIAKQAFELLALGLLWLNLRPFNHTLHNDGFDNRIGKSIASIASILPAVVCVLVSAEMAINFSFVSLSLTTLNRTLDTIVHFTPDVESMTITTTSPQATNFRRIESITRTRVGKFRNLIVLYDELGDTALALLEFYSPILLLIIGIHFVLFTLQLYLSYREMSGSTSDTVCADELGHIFLSLLSVVSSAVQIIFVLHTTASFNQKVRLSLAID
ncbi:AGAP004716-PA-like protein [Anopheles sinensis]|uniref:AGAP004716-PA-like protein n=1 Tax=Anopheles sinensis TaxID=74873 RepID=A0A084W1B8_ANOSI|nr:AGAP004716-PA-like protein [Anopheles sinensis]